MRHQTALKISTVTGPTQETNYDKALASHKLQLKLVAYTPNPLLAWQTEEVLRHPFLVPTHLFQVGDGHGPGTPVGVGEVALAVVAA